jgi:hypothetical protein
MSYVICVSVDVINVHLRSLLCYVVCVCVCVRVICVVFILCNFFISNYAVKLD